MAIEMTIVMPPFVVDFASASLDVSIEFSEEIWADWERTKQEQFGLQWETVSDWSDVRLASVHKHLRFCDLCKEPGILSFVRVWFARGGFGKLRPTLVWCLLCPLASMVPVLWR